MKIVSVPAGEDVVAAIATAGEAWVSGTGHVEGVELRVAGESTDPTRALRGRLTLVSLSGRAQGPLTACVARATDSGLELLGGVLVRARSAGVEIMIHGEAAPAVTGTVSAGGGPDRRVVATRSDVAAPARRSNSDPPIADPSSSPNAPSAPDWAGVAAASEEAADAAPVDDDDDPFPMANDLVDHFSFGLCEVLMSDGDRLKIRDLRGPGRIREVALAMLKVSPPTRSNGKRLFRLLRKT